MTLKDLVLASDIGWICNSCFVFEQDCDHTRDITGTKCMNCGDGVYERFFLVPFKDVANVQDLKD